MWRCARTDNHGMAFGKQRHRFFFYLPWKFEVPQSPPHWVQWSTIPNSARVRNIGFFPLFVIRWSNREYAILCQVPGYIIFCLRMVYRDLKNTISIYRLGIPLNKIFVPLPLGGANQLIHSWSNPFPHTVIIFLDKQFGIQQSSQISIFVLSPTLRMLPFLKVWIPAHIRCHT